MSISITAIIIIITCLVSITAFYNSKVHDDLIFYPPAITYDKQYYRFFTCGLIHANYMHLVFNMYSFWIFGREVEHLFNGAFGTELGRWLYLGMYITALFFCLIPTYIKNKTNQNYLSLGASGAVAAVIFAFIFLDPLRNLGPIGLSDKLHLPGFVFGAIYLIASSYFDRRGGGNINHSAHIWGALYGISFLIVTGSFLSDHNLLMSFISKIRYHFHL